jgi:hypothetical protein
MLPVLVDKKNITLNEIYIYEKCVTERSYL